MSKLRTDLALKELKKRASTSSQSRQLKIEDFCFDKQIAFINDPARFKVAVCSRRSGKTIACAVDLIFTAAFQQGDVAYITLNRRTAKKIIWRELLKINKDYGLGAKADNTELTLTMPNGSVLHLSGAKDETEAEKFRGLALRKVYIDETQSFRPYIKDMIEDVLEPALTDYNGTLVLIGTPGPVPVGFFYETSQSPNWSQHHWTMQENPHIQLKSGRPPLDIINELAKRRGLTIDAPSIQREYFGQWRYDNDSRVYQFDPERNTYVCDVPDDCLYIFGVDIGYVDADAITVLGYSPAQQKVYCVQEYIRAKSDITSLANKIKELQATYQPVKMVMDAGALGKKIQEEILQRHQVYLEAAEKQRKSEFITLLNDDLRTSKLQFKPGSRFEQDSYLLQWDWSNPARPVISTDYHSDIGDAVLYAWRECKHFYDKHEVPEALTADAYMKRLEEFEAQAMQDAQRNDGAFTDVNSWQDLGVTDDDHYN